MTVNAWNTACAVAVAVALSGLVIAARLAQSAPAAQAAPKTPGAHGTPPAAAVKLPAAVEGAFKKAYPDARIKNVSHEIEDGIAQYEIESLNHGLELDVNYKPDGTVIVIEEEVAPADLPAPVLAAIVERYPRATLLLRERATEGKTTFYEVSLKGAPVKSVQLTPEGQWMSPKPGK